MLHVQYKCTVYDAPLCYSAEQMTKLFLIYVQYYILSAQDILIL